MSIEKIKDIGILIKINHSIFLHPLPKINIKKVYTSLGQDVDTDVSEIYKEKK